KFIALYTDIYEKRFITQDIIVWLNTQKWIANISHCMATIDFSFERAASAEAEIIYGDMSWSMMKVYSIYPEAFAKLYKLDTYILGGYLVSNETAALIPSNLGIPIGETMQVNLILWTEGGDIHIPVGRVKVKGLFNPGALSEVKRPDGKPMFENPDHTVIVTMNSLPMTVAGIKVFDIPWLFIIPTNGSVDLVGKAEEIVHLFGCDVCVPVDGYLVSYEEVHMYRIIGLSGVVVPIAIICMMVYLTMYSTIYERNRDLRVLAVLGGTPRSITNMLLTEGLILGLFSSFIGYFGTYVLYLLLDRISMLVPSIWGVVSLESIPWGAHTILLSLLIGTAMPLLSVYLSTMRAKTLALVSRESRRSVEKDLRVIGERGEFPLPIRTTMFEGDLLYAYFDELFSTKLKSTRASGQLFQDGTFEFRFPILSENQLVINCRLTGVRRDETIYPIVEFPAEFRGAKALHEFLYRLEKLSLGYTVWKESKLKIKIVRTAPTKKEKTPEDILAEVKLIQDEIKLVKGKLERLESMRPKVSSAIYEEYHGRYTTQIEELMRKLRPLALELEPYYDILLDEVKRISLELEKLDVAKNLGELSEEEYIEKASPLEEQLKGINIKIVELDNLFKELRLPRGMRTLTSKRSGET
ncbi:MAG: FtsX-like permease family protein, partial [Candidatus Bathyarchaeia archaeon]